METTESKKHSSPVAPRKVLSDSHKRARKISFSEFEPVIPKHGNVGEEQEYFLTPDALFGVTEEFKVPPLREVRSDGYVPNT